MPADSSRCAVQQNMPDTTSLLHRYRYAIRIKSILGLCPFTLRHNSASSTIVQVTRWSTGYAIVYCTLQFVVYLCTEIRIFSKMNLVDLTGTRIIAILFEQITMFVVFSVILWLHLWNRHAHARLLNCIATVYDRLETMRTPNGGKQRNLQSLNVLNATLIGVYSAWAIAATCIASNLPDGIYGYAYLVMYVLGMGTVLLAVLHVREVALLLGDVQRACIVAARPMAGRNGMWRCDRALSTLNDVHQLRDDFEECFGGVMLVCDTKDVLTTMSFYLLSDIVFESGIGSWNLWLIVIMFVVPILVTNGLAFVTFDRLEEQSQLLQRYLAWEDLHGLVTTAGV